MYIESLDKNHEKNLHQSVVVLEGEAPRGNFFKNLGECNHINT
jgi:hypothetical protein